ncbi:MAG: hypothetical protein GX899_06970 [Rikenellaceae bacterium]|nr:hypothetical protein [Rikenellaceae bacterium]
MLDHEAEMRDFRGMGWKGLSRKGPKMLDHEAERGTGKGEGRQRLLLQGPVPPSAS